MMTCVQDKIIKFVRKYVKIGQHTNIAAIRLFDNSQDISRVKRRRPYDLLYNNKLRPVPLNWEL